MNEIHPLVLATIENERAGRELELERLRSAREACITSSAGGQNRAMALGKKIRQLEEITGSWRLVLATVLGSMDEMTEAAEGATSAFQALATVLDDDPRGEACPHDCDSCHSSDCPCPRMGCAGDPDREDEDDGLPVVAFPDGSTMRGETDEQFQKRMGLDVLGPKLETEAPLRVVGSKSPRLGKLRCVPCTAKQRAAWGGSTDALVDVTSEDLPDGGVCSQCHGDVLA